jgi:hypothetical protein
MNAPIRSLRRGGSCDRGPCARRSALGIKLTVLLVLAALFLIVFVTGLIRGLG